jgi:hypothetical protein
MLRRVALVRTDVTEELSDSIIGVTTIGELETLNKRTDFMALALKLILPTDRPPLGEVTGNFCRQLVSRGQRNGSPRQ